MKSFKKFLKSSYLIIIGFAVGATVLYVGAQLQIPTNIDNSVQVIKKIILSTDGVSTTGDNVIVTIDSDPTMTTKVKIRGNMDVGDDTNSIFGTWSSIAGGEYNSVTGNRSTIVGGMNHTIEGDKSVIAGGQSNKIQGNDSSIVGGYDNIIAGNYSTIAGGNQNVITGDYGFAAGYFNRLDAGNSMAFGSYSRILHDGVFMRSDSYDREGNPPYLPSRDFTSTEDYTFLIRAYNGVAINTGGTASGESSLTLNVWGDVGAMRYCNENGTNCIDADDLGEGLWTATGTDIYNSNTGNVGIGTDSPADKLHVDGNIRVAANSYIYSSGGNLSIFSFNGDLIMGGFSGTTTIGSFGEETKVQGGYGYKLYLNGGPNTFPFCSGPTCSAEDIILAHNGTRPQTAKVGIRTNSPTAVLDINGDIRIRDVPAAASANNALTIDGSGKVYYATFDSLISGNSYRGKNGADIYNANAGNVGIGTNNPSADLQVVGNLVVGHSSNQAGGTYSSVLGGSGNAASASYSIVGGGRSNSVGGSYSFIGGGKDNTANYSYSVIGGGESNSAGLYSYSTVGGGKNNTAGDIYSTVGGGLNNTGAGQFSTVGGGTNNAANESSATVGGGDGNISASAWSTVGGGLNNEANKSSATVGGGKDNQANGLYSTVPGGANNTAGGDVSFAAGNRAKANHNGTFVRADGQGSDFSSTDTNQFLIRASNGVGIGTSNPNAALDVVGNVEADSFTINGTPVGTSTDTYWSTGGGGKIFYAGGNIGIGTSNPTEALTVIGNALMANTLFSQGAIKSQLGLLGGDGYDFSIGATNGAAPLFCGGIFPPCDGDGGNVILNGGNKYGNGVTGNVIMANNGGKVGIGTNNPSYKLYVNGSAGGTTAWTNDSDARYKKNIAGISQALDKILLLNGVSFDRKDIPGKNFSNGKQIGLIAQEVERIFPEVVLTDYNGYKSLAYSSLVAPIIEAIKEMYDKYLDQQGEIDALEERVKKLEGLVNDK